MEPTDGWVDLTEEKKLKIFEFYKMADNFKHVDLIYFKIAVAKYGGPIAVARDITQQAVIQFSENAKENLDNIIFYSNNGNPETKVYFKDEQKIGKIVGYDFIQDELLLVFFHTGDYVLVDPFKPNQKKQFNLGVKFKDESILSCKVFDNGFAFLTIFNQFYFVQDARDPIVRTFSPCDLKDKNPKFYSPIGPKNSQSQSTELWIADPQAGVIVLYEETQKKHYFNKLLQEKGDNQINLNEIPNIEFISVSPSYNYIAFLTKQGEKGSVHIQSADLLGKTQIEIEVFVQHDGNNIDLYAFLQKQELQRPYQFLWCGEDCIAIVLHKVLLIVDIDLDKVYKRKLRAFDQQKISQTGVFCSSEIDGLRIISKRRNEFLYRLPPSYLNIFILFSKDPGAKIYEAYKQFEDKLPLEDEDIRNKKNELEDGVKDCIDAGSVEMNSEYQSKLLKAASFGKTFLSATQTDHGKLFEVCKYLRVINNIKNEKMNRTLTFKQMKNIDEETFVRIMLRYNLHHLALQITQFLGFQDQNKLIPYIYEHWACCKIEEDCPEEELCYKIQEKLSVVNGISYTEIAQRAIEINKQKLAMKLLDNEPSIPKRIPILIGMAETVQSDDKNQYFEKAIEEALKSYDNNLIFLVMLVIMNSKLAEDYIFKLFSPQENEILKSQFVYYLKYFKRESLDKYLERKGLNNELGYQYLYQACCIKDQKIMNKRLEFLKKSSSYFTKIQEQDSVTIKIVESYIETTSQYIQNIQKSQQDKTQFQLGIDEIIPVNSICKQLALNNKDGYKNAIDQQKGEKISDKRFNIIRARQFIKLRQFEELKQLVEKENKKKVVIPFELIAEELMDQGENGKALEYIYQMRDINEQIELLLWINCSQEAVKQAIKSKDDKIIEHLRNTVKDQVSLNTIDQYFESKKKK